MDCKEVKKYLDSYIDNDIDSTIKKVIKAHLQACEDCTLEYKELKSYKKAVGGLKKVKAPASFLNEINQKIDNPPLIKRIIEKIFFPLKIKLPIEAAGVLATVVIVLFIFNPMKSLKKDIIPFEETAISERSEPREPGERPENPFDSRAYDFAVSDEFAGVEADKSVVPASEVMLASKKIAGEVPSVVPTAPEAEAVKEVLSEEAPDKRLVSSRSGMSSRREGRRRRVVTYEIALLIRSGSVKDFKRGLTDDMVTMRSTKDLDVAPDGTAGAKVDAQESVKEGEKEETKKAPLKQKAKSHIAVRVSDSAEDIKSIALRLGGKIIKKEYDSKTNKVKYIVVDVPVEKYGRFIYEIRRIGKLKKAAPKEPVKSRKMQNFKIYLIDK